MRTIAIHEAKNNFSALIHSVEIGEEIVLTRHGKRIARIIGETDDAQTDALLAQKRLEAAKLLSQARAKVLPGMPMDWKTARDAGRRF
ncbi:MAG: type II toxin-antitoxin system prevent-host-death family antitoxin [Burkholderiales bacterium]|jgi:prevent-host-death family protein|nr:MAG: type II toxin-antitoxin system prevent-host-death family antitoxin [Burkholderiales bacterium]